MAGALAESMQLGKTPNTDVLAISFSSTDEVGHLFGPQSQEIQDTLARLDQTLGALFDKLDALVGRNRYVVALSADHGVTPIPERARREGKDAGRVDPAEIADAIETQLLGAWGRGRYVAALAGTNMNVYFYPGVYERLRMAPALADGVIRRLQLFPGVSRVFRAEQIREASAITSTDSRTASGSVELLSWP
jgi:predicted AlkP superfamily pyrophosphatase or phosphodiesterase